MTSVKEPGCLYQCRNCGWIGTEAEMAADCSTGGGESWCNTVCPQCDRWSWLDEYEKLGVPPGLRATPIVRPRKPAPPVSPAMRGLLGHGPGPPKCKVVSADVSVHWWDAKAKPGTRCMCGKTLATEPE